MPDPVWYRSLYWRIAFGFVALLSTLLVVQGLVFLWMTGRMTELFPSRSPAQIAAAIAADVGATLEEQPDIDINAYVQDRHSSSYRGFVVVLADGRTVISQRVPPPPQLLRTARGRLFGDGPRRGGGRGSRVGGDFGDGMRGDRRDGPGRGGDAGGAPGVERNLADRLFVRGGGGPPGTTEFALISVHGSVAGIVAVPREPPPLWLAMQNLGPTLAVVALGLLVSGTSVAALLIFRPTRRRLQQLQDAARALGAGETGVRAPVSGGDEVTSLSRVFNDMASQLELRTQALETADRTRRRLLADVSHELTTPLAAIRGYVETLAMPDLHLDPASRSRYLAIVNEEAERLEHIVGDLLDLAKLEGGGGSVRFETVPVAQLLERVRHRHEPAVAAKGLTLATSQAAGVESVFGDQNRLEQALQNLVANAIRHTPPGGRVDVRAEALDGGGVLLRVDDTGPGIPPEHLPRVFDRFYKADESRTGTAMPSGSGLGLSIVQAIVSRHGGTVSASNVPGGGARFEILLPSGVTGEPPSSSVAPSP
jgi:signal transduction histidine kinase